MGVSAVLCGCSLMPGMKNLSSTQYSKVIVPDRIPVHPTIIPITPSLITHQKINTYFYQVAATDVIDVNVWEHPEFSMTAAMHTSSPVSGDIQVSSGSSGYLVNARGEIFFPLLGRVKVAGKTMDQISELLASKLKRYVPNPQVMVRVTEFRGQKIYVLGEVGRNGFLPINDEQMSIADALALSGWINPSTSDPRFIYVIRGDFLHPKIYWLDAKTPDKILLAQRFSMKPHDILYVSTAPLTNFNRFLDEFLPIIQTVWFTKSIVS